METGENVMDCNAFMTIHGQAKGGVKYAIVQGSRQSSIQVIGTSYGDAPVATRLSERKRYHSPFVIIKEVDELSPILQNALRNGENIASWRLEISEGQEKGLGEQSCTIELKNAIIARIDHESVERERVSFYYEKIIWSWKQMQELN